jgi:hypothetical protein
MGLAMVVVSRLAWIVRAHEVTCLPLVYVIRIPRLVSVIGARHFDCRFSCDCVVVFVEVG